MHLSQKKLVFLHKVNPCQASIIFNSKWAIKQGPLVIISVALGAVEQHIFKIHMKSNNVLRLVSEQLYPSRILFFLIRLHKE